MVDFNPTPEQKLIAQTARDYAQRHLKPKAAQRDQTGEFPKAELRALADLGLLGVGVPAELGGAEAGAVSYALAMMELAGACPSTAVTVAVTNMTAELITAFGTDAQKRTYVPQLTDGTAICGAFALSEPYCGSDPASLQTTAKKTDRGWVLNGTKQWITSGDHAQVMIVWARTGDPGAKGVSAFVVYGRPAGMTVGKHEEKMGLRGSSTVALNFEECLIPTDALLGDVVGRGFPIAMAALDGGRIGIASQALGIAIAAQRQAIDYAKQRQTFGHPIAEHQAIQWMIADSATEIEAARLLILRAAMLKDQKAQFSQAASMAKVYATEAANRICYRALQIHGGYGYTRDFPLEQMTRDVRVTTIYEGTSEIQRVVIARSLLRA